MTGAPLPDGADAVCMVERTRTEPGGRWVVIEDAVPAARSVRAPGSDIASGSEVVPAGTELTPVHLGVLARLGLESAPVYRPPKVGVLSTGDELREGPAPLPRGAIRDGNRPVLRALVEEVRLPGDRPRHRPRRRGRAAPGVRETPPASCDAWSPAAA